MTTIEERIAQEVNYDLLPGHLREGLKRYVEKGSPVGHFLTACLSNSLIDAVGRADQTNREHLVGIVQFLWNELPLECYGSKEKVGQWIAKGGLFGRNWSVTDSEQSRERNQTDR